MKDEGKKRNAGYTDTHSNLIAFVHVLCTNTVKNSQYKMEICCLY